MTTETTYSLLPPARRSLRANAIATVLALAAMTLASLSACADSPVHQHVQVPGHSLTADELTALLTGKVAGEPMPGGKPANPLMVPYQP